MKTNWIDILLVLLMLIVVGSPLAISLYRLMR